MCFFGVASSETTTHHTNVGEKSAPPLFLEDKNFFQKSASMVLWGIGFPEETWRPIFEKKVLIFEKKGGADAF
jgi:hypothetical protein